MSLNRLQLLLGFGFGLANKGGQHEQDFHTSWVAPFLRDFHTHEVDDRAHVLGICTDEENGFGVARSKFAPSGGRSCLEEKGRPLR